MIDYHTHTCHSIDANGSIQEYCEQALKLGLKEICITNHCELDVFRNDSLIRFDNDRQPLTRQAIIRLRDEVIKAKEFYKKHGLSVRFGLEVGYFDGIESRLQKIMDGINFDFLLGSIHCLNHICIDSSKEHSLYFSMYTVPELLNNYLQAIEKLINSNLFDSIGHLDVYKKYGLNFYGKEIDTFPEDYLKKIFRIMMEKGIALEINTAGLRRIKEFYPSSGIMKCAREQGVKLITIGSDCHKLEDLGRDIEDGLEYAKSFGFGSVYGFEKRRPIEIKI